jgi:hypothetical protein
MKLAHAVALIFIANRLMGALYYNIAAVYNVTVYGHTITGECGYPTPADEMVTVHSHTEGPWLEGHTISYSCASQGLKVTETNTSTCMDNGQWEPDPSDITCIGNHKLRIT